MPYFNFELTGISRISFATADDPFYKSLRSKYYPEVVYINHKSQIKAILNHMTAKDYPKFANVFEYLEDFREPTMNVNDDRKIKINLGELMKKSTPGKMILLMVKCNDMRRQPPKQGEFDRAWYRILNDDTSQTLDYSNIKKVPKPEGFDEDAPINADEGNEDAQAAPQLTYLAGRIFLDTNNRWVYEAYNHTFTSDKFPDLYEKLAEIHQTSEEDLARQTQTIDSIKAKLIEL